MAFTKCPNKSTQNAELFNYYLTVNMNNICRICLEKGPKLMPIFDPVKPPHFSILIMACAAVQVMEGDGLPSFICHKCLSKLHIAFQFKTLCESSDAKLRQCFENLQTIQNTSNLADYADIKKGDDQLQFEDDTDELHVINSDGQLIHDDGLGTDHEQLVHDDLQLLQGEHADLVDIRLQEPHIETLQNVKLESATLDEINKTDELKDLKLDLSDLKGTDMDLKLNDVNIIMENNNAIDGVIISDNKRPPKQHQCDTCGKIFKTKPGLIHHIRIHTGERPYVCHLCDKRFINGGHLHTHMRTHTGEKNHVCAACSKAFSTAQQLTKHTIAIHTSERPYACTYCPKRFASSSNLNTHTKIHTGEKNYHCDQCTKAFSTKGQLYQHLLVHTGEKAFLCEHCHKRFSQKAHLVRHLKVHKT